MQTAASPLKLEFTLLDVKNKTGVRSSFGSRLFHKPMAIDFWHTRCENCPLALNKLDAAALEYPHATFIACAISLGQTNDGTQEHVLELLDDQLENMEHVYMNVHQKEAAKAYFGFTKVPFCVVLDSSGVEKFKGDPKEADFATLLRRTPDQVLSHFGNVGEFGNDADEF